MYVHLCRLHLGGTVCRHGIGPVLNPVEVTHACMREVEVARFCWMHVLAQEAPLPKKHNQNRAE